MEQISFKNEQEAASLLDKIIEYNPHADLEKIKKAFFITDQYSWEIAKTLIGFKADTPTILCSLLYTAFTAKRLSEEVIEKEYGKETLDILKGIIRINLLKFKTSEAENVRKIIFAMSKDVRILLIKLAERVQKMKELKQSPLSLDEKKQIAEEILHVYAPIAYKLGVYAIKSELEDSSLYFLKPDVYKDLKEKMGVKKEERQKQVAKIVEKVQQLLKEKEINATVLGRAKHFYSIYRKMEGQGKRFNEILDLLAIRIITENIDDCYRILGIMHSSFTPILSEFSDYIANPKQNMYQSIHTKIIFEGKPIEVQIRTLGMHQIAEEGIAAHWRYKDTERDKLFDKKIAWMKQILEWKSSAAAKEFIDSLRIDLFKNEIMTLTPEGDPISLPEDSTPVDFAYYVHTAIGNSCDKAKVNGSLVSLDHPLKAGDVIEILTSKKAHPSRNWLKFAKTTFARSKIRESLHIKGVQYDETDDERKISAVLLEPKTKEQGRIIIKQKPHFARCCRPVIGDKIIAIVTKEEEINIHKISCENLKAMDQSRKLAASWKSSDQEAATLIITVSDRIGVFADVLNAIASSGISVNSINTKVKKDKANIIMDVNYHGKDQFHDALSRVKQIKNVESINKE